MVAIKKKKLAEYVIEEIKRMIDSGELKEGDKLPNQLEFSAQIGVSRPSLREALNTLTRIGTIEQRPGMGTVIKSANPALWVEQPPPPLVSDAEATLEIVEARRFIEVSVTKLAVKTATPQDIKIMGKLVDNMIIALKEDRTEDYAEFDMKFHHKIADASYNRYMVHMFITIRGLMEQFIKEAFILIPGLYVRSLKFHKGIYRGIKERNSDRAASNMENHILDIEKSLRHYYDNK